MFDIWDHIDCGEEECPHYHYHPGCTEGDPDKCYPAESECAIDAQETGRCACMEALICDMVRDGQLETEHGYFIDREWALQVQREGGDGEADAWFFDFDFAAAPYWLIYDTNDKPPCGFKNESEIYRECFR
jgi:hypothetical protein